MPPKPLVSAVVSTRNERAHIETCLSSLALQDYPNLEMIVVDNFSTDGTADLARKYTPHVFSLGPERSAQRNFGLLTAAKGELALFLDADMIASPTLVGSAVDLFLKDPDLVGLYVGEVILGRSFFSRVRRHERQFYDGTVVDGVRVFRTEALARTGGFDQSLWGGEDWDLDKRLKAQGKLGNLPRVGPGPGPNWPLRDFVRERGVKPDACGPVIFHNESEFELSRYLEKKRYYSGSLDNYRNKWGAKDPDVSKQLSPWYRLLIIFLERGGLLRLLSRPHLSLGMWFLRFAVALTFLTRKRKAT